jgi:hypothetical protein
MRISSVKEASKKKIRKLVDNEKKLKYIEGYQS